ncbi:MAG TPA: FtsX-like permease family protein [Acidobacteriota bacterium]|nr:FtsX-like permease family protein [Acidobacteriota bacterium]
MNVIKVVLKELTERKNQLTTSLIAIVMGISVIVGVRSITYYSEKAIALEMDALGANVLILPKGVTVDDYYRADLGTETMPESYVDDILTSGLKGVDNLSPKLSMVTYLGDRRTIVTGIKPKEEFLAKPIWEMAGNIFETPVGCAAPPGGTPPQDPDAVDRRTPIEALPTDGALLGSELAGILNLSEGDTLAIEQETFLITGVLPPSGTVDDSRVFVHLSAVQRMTQRPGRISAIEMMGCCEQISGDLISGLNRRLPDAKVVTIGQIVSAQQRTNAMMRSFGLIFLVIILLVGGVSITNYMFANVFERRREIGILIALGARRTMIQRIFLLKALLLGLVGGVGGYLVGTVLAIILGPSVAGISVRARPDWLILSVAVSVVLSLLASVIPVSRATRLDPAATLQEV